MLKAYTADKIFTGEKWMLQHAVVVDDYRIQSIVPLNQLPPGCSISNFDGHFIAPAFIDLQIYGAYGKLFSVFPNAESLSLLNQYCEKGGAAFCMPTMATNTLDVFKKGIDAIRNYWNAGGRGVLGLHLEGPWINPLKRGAHIESYIHAPAIGEVRSLLEYGKDVIRIITLAPEVCSPEVISLVRSQGIIISAGHSNATFKEAKTGFTNGITTVTHLFNAMSPLQHREPGLAGAAMDDASVMASIIPDGYHVDYAAVRIAKKVMQDRLFVITDAVTETTSGAYQHYKSGDKYEAAGVLSGSALDMLKAVANLVLQAGISLEEALRMCSFYPARVIRREHELGLIQNNYLPAMAVITNSLDSAAVIN